MPEAEYGFTDEEHYDSHRVVFNPYKNKGDQYAYVRKAKKVTWNPYTKRQYVTYASSKPIAVNKDTGLPLKWTEMTTRQRLLFQRPEEKRRSRLDTKGEEDQKIKYSRFKRCFHRWMNGVLDLYKSRATAPEWLRQKEVKAMSLLPPRIKTFLMKPNLKREELAEFSAWLENERAPSNMKEFLFFSHYNKPNAYNDGSLPSDHEYFEFESEVNDFQTEKHYSLRELNILQPHARLSTLFEFKEDVSPSDRRYRQPRGRFRSLRPHKAADLKWRIRTGRNAWR